MQIGFNGICQLLYRLEADKALDFPAVLKEGQRGDAFDAKLEGCGLVVVDIHFCDDSPAFESSRKFPDNRFLGTAGTAPGCAEIHQGDTGMDGVFKFLVGF